MHVSTLSLFNQIAEKSNSSSSWQGDWVFRRERLALIDQGVRKFRPDILFMQSALSKSGSDFDSDRDILKAGALGGYDWQEIFVKQYSDLQNESLALASTVPLVIRDANKEQSKLWRFSDLGQVGIFSVSLGREDFLLLNIHSPTNKDNAAEWYSFLRNQMNDLLSETRVCQQRMIVAGYINADVENVDYQHWLADFSLVDTSFGYCEEESKCFTGSSTNEIYTKMMGDSYQERSDRILVHKDALVLAAGLEFNQPGSIDVPTYGLKKIWPSSRFGWGAFIRFPKCD